ncbi:MAG: undecaprenyl-phosphate galactose phosphotransferase WbaP [Candidatus Aminicenantes bacterium]|nr:undecaprenyl-phosphate galactose phosphotransferase WbaP [Candidatus Aminicenantes bacterium]
MAKKILSLLALMAADGAAILLCFLMAFLIRQDVLPLLFPALLARPVLWSIYISHAYLLFLWIAVFSYEKLYTKRHAMWEETGALIKSSTISSTLIMVAVFTTKSYVLYSRAIIVMAWLLSLAVLPVFRATTKRLLTGLHLWKKKVIIIGSANGTSVVIESIRRNKSLGYDIVGCLTDDRSKIGLVFSNVTILGHYDEIETWKDRTGFEDIIVTLPDIPGDQFISLLKRWDGVSDTIRYIPRTGDLITTGIEIENIGKVLSLVVRKNLHKPWNILMKTIFEFILSVILLVPLLPVFLIIAAAIRLDSRGPAFFRQERYGKRGKLIKVIKFRSMHIDADLRLDEYLKRNPDAREGWTTFKKLKTSDPRVTRVGAFLRKFSLDELPQVLNVLLGEMSLVGPRPYLHEELEEVKQMKSILFQVKPGVTGLWQTSGRSLVPFEERLRLDEYYIRNWSLWMDLLILMKTVKVTASGHGAF